MGHEWGCTAGERTHEAFVGQHFLELYHRDRALLLVYLYDTAQGKILKRNGSITSGRTKSAGLSLPQAGYPIQPGNDAESRTQFRKGEAREIPRRAPRGRRFETSSGFPALSRVAEQGIRENPRHGSYLRPAQECGTSP